MSLTAWSTDPRLQRILTHPDDDTAAWRSDLRRFLAGDAGLTRRSAGEAAIMAVQRLMVFLGYSASIDQARPVRYSLASKPPNLPWFRKKTRAQLLFVSEPFEIETQEGVMRIHPDTVDDWDGGYYIAFPDDGSKPYGIAPAYVHANYEAVD